MFIEENARELSSAKWRPSCLGLNVLRKWLASVCYFKIELGVKYNGQTIQNLLI